MWPFALTLGPFQINAHGVMTAAGVLVAWLLARREVARKGLSLQALEGLVFTSLMAGIAGARLYYILFADPGGYLGSPSRIIAFWEGGMALQGGLIGGLLAGIWYCSRHELPFWRYADAIAPGLLLGQAIGRLGDLLVGGEYGTPTDLPWAITFTDPRAQAPLNVPLHPTQLYEMVWDLLVLGFLWRSRQSAIYEGQSFLAYGFLYSLGRFFIEYFRGDQLTYTLFGQTLSAAMTVSALAMALALALHVHRRRILKEKT